MRTMLTTRRQAMKWTGAAAHLLPFLRSPRIHAAEGPRRVIFFFTIQGVLRPLWTPQSSGGSFSFGPLQTPLEPFKARTVLLDGLNFKSYELFGGGSNGHWSGNIHALTSAKPGSVKDRAGGPSIDYFLSEELAKKGIITPFKFLVHTVQGSNTNGSKVTLESTPVHTKANTLFTQSTETADTLFKKMFPAGWTKPGGQPGGDAGTPAADPALGRRRSVLDFLAREYGSVKASLPSWLPKEQADKFDHHATLIRDLELRLAPAPGSGGSSFEAGAACNKPGTTPSNAEYANNRADYEARAAVNFDLIKIAAACDMTRVFTLLVGMPPIDGVNNQHDLCHQTSDKTSGTGVDKVQDSQTNYFKQMARLAKALDEIPEGNGTALDNSAIVWTGQIASGGHDKNDHRWTIVGGLGGAIRTGRHLKLNGTPHSNLFVSLANGMGVNINSFGAPEACTGPLAGLA